MNRQTRTALLWAFIPMGYIFHTLCELMPLFAGLSVATEEMTSENLPAMTTFTGWALYLVHSSVCSVAATASSAGALSSVSYSLVSHYCSM